MMKAIALSFLCTFIAHAMTEDDRRTLWISKKLLCTFLPTSACAKLKNTIDISISEIQHISSITGEVLFKKTLPSFVLDMYDTLNQDIIDHIASTYIMLPSQSMDKSKIKQAYVNSYTQYKRFPRSTWIEKLSLQNPFFHSDEHRYEMPYTKHRKHFTIITQRSYNTIIYKLMITGHKTTNTPSCVRDSDTSIRYWVKKDKECFMLSKDKILTHVNLETNVKVGYNVEAYNFNVIRIDTYRKKLLCTGAFNAYLVEYQHSHAKECVRFKDLFQNLLYPLNHFDYDTNSGLLHVDLRKENISFEDPRSHERYIKKSPQHNPLLSSCYDARVGIFGVDSKGVAKLYKPRLNCEEMERFLPTMNLYEYTLMHSLLQKRYSIPS